MIDLGDRVSGMVLDAARWEHEDRARPALPRRWATGAVHVIWPRAPRVVGIRTDDGEQLTVQVLEEAPEWTI